MYVYIFVHCWKYLGEFQWQISIARDFTLCTFTFGTHMYICAHSLLIAETFTQQTETKTKEKVNELYNNTMFAVMPVEWVTKRKKP